MNLRTFFGVLAATICLLPFITYAQQADSSDYWLNPVEVTSVRLTPGSEKVVPNQSYLKETFHKNGFQMVQRGGILTGDLYADGLKRGDISLVIDGERFTNACPNRMDPPVSRVNPMLVESVTLNKSSHSVFSSIGGSVEITRKQVSDHGFWSGSLTGATGSDDFTETNLLGNYLNHRVSIRYIAGNSYENADGKTFKDLYGYLDNYRFNQFDGAFDGQSGQVSYGFSFTRTEDISFPYLQMDERSNDVAGVYAGWNGHKIYANYTEHLMDNLLRTSSKSSIMSTRVWNSTIGVTGNHYDLYARHWNARNTIGDMKNHQIPDLGQYCGSVNQSWTLTENWSLLGKIGISYYRIGDTDVMANYQLLEPDAKETVLFVPYSAAIQGTMPVTEKLISGFSVESASDAPVPENMFINVDKPMSKPDWFGNPTLKAPLRNTLRGYLTGMGVKVETFISSVNNYVVLSKVQKNQKAYLSFDNADVVLAGINLSGTWSEYLIADAGYTIAENRSAKKPLAEVAPFHVNVSANSPEWNGLTGTTTLVWNDSQTRIDENLNERPGQSWTRLDAGLRYHWSGFNISMMVQNLTNENYSQFLSYLRDPFASGLSVTEPGRSIIFSIQFLSGK